MSTLLQDPQHGPALQRLLTSQGCIQHHSHKRVTVYAVIVLAGNKSDMAEARQVTVEEGQAYAAA